VRSYVERWFHTLKDRLRVFNCSFPRSTRGLTHTLIFIRFYAFYYNQVRPHRTLSGRTPIPTRGATRLQRLQHALEVTRNP
nr:integrase core domain-containing protein [Candidatus Njordarchaeota archaeon]